MKWLFAVLVLSIAILLVIALAVYARIRRYRKALQRKREQNGPDTVTVDIKR